MRKCLNRRVKYIIPGKIGGLTGLMKDQAGGNLHLLFVEVGKCLHLYHHMHIRAFFFTPKPNRVIQLHVAAVPQSEAESVKGKDDSTILTYIPIALSISLHS